MAEQEVGEAQLGAILEATRDFAFQLMKEKGKLVPFAARAGQSGDIEYFRIADEESTVPADQIYSQMQDTLADQAKKGEIIAATSVAHVGSEQGIGEEGYNRAIRIHVEAAGYSRFVYAPYDVVPSEEAGTALIQPGNLVAQEAESVIFAG